MNRFRIKIVGESGTGLLSTGEIITKSIEAMGFNIVTDREYQSLIKGGYSAYTLNVSTDEIHGVSQYGDVMIAIDRASLEAYHSHLKDGGLLIHAYDRVKGIQSILDQLTERGCEVVACKGRELAESLGGSVLMVNVVLIGMLWKVLGFDYKYVEQAVTNKFKNKPKLLAIDLKCLEAGFNTVETKLDLVVPEEPEVDQIVLNGNRAISLGAIHAGCRAFFAYPMSPASTILGFMKEYSHDTGMHVQQVEDEISVAQMVIGAMHAGTRSMGATSGGGFALMTETVSLSGMIECPFVMVIAQRPGPATGMPTWTGQGDLNLAMHAGHGEFPRIVVAVSDPEDCFELIQHAFNLAEEYQSPVMVLTEKVICEGLWSVKPFAQKTVPIKRGLVPEAEWGELENTDRFKITESGLSKRWLPGTSDAYYFANCDEHLEDGSLTEDGEEASKMYAKRNRKLDLIRENLPDPEVYGEAGGADISFVGWGSSRNVMRDTIADLAKAGIKVNYLHASYLHPLRTERIEQFFKENENVHLIEGNYTGQFGDLVEMKTGAKFAGRLLKWDGRPFFLEDTESYIKANLKA